MANIEAFEKLTKHYDQWFEEHSDVYAAELEAIRALLPAFQSGIEIGVGTGRFAAPLGIKTGLEPSRKMGRIAQARGIHVVQSKAEAMPLKDLHYDLVLMVTTICFVDSPLTCLREIHRILKPGAHVIIGFVDEETPLGRFYLKHQDESRFYQSARFFSSKKVMTLLKKAGFAHCRAVQTLFGESLEAMLGGIMEGFGVGAFVAIRCTKEELG